MILSIIINWYQSLFFFWRFAVGGYSIVLIARKESSLQPVQKELEQQGHTGYFYSLSYICLSIYVFYSVALSITGDASDISSLKNAFNTIRTKFGSDPEVLLYNPSVYQRSKLNILFCIHVIFCILRKYFGLETWRTSRITE